MNQDVIVVGHKNPDTDSICSAITYAHLKTQISSLRHIPMRAGELNSETKFVLKHFGVEVPHLIEFVGTQVKDIEIKKLTGLSEEYSLKKAWLAMQDANVATMSVTEGNKLSGIISHKDIATANMDIYDNRILSKSKTQYRNIMETLDGTISVGDPDQYFTRGKILIAAGNPEALESFIEEGDLVILGNRYEIQFCAIEMKADCLIVCLGSPVSKTILQLAKDRGCTIITTPHDTYTAARLINQSTPISYFMRREELITFHLDDYNDEVKNTMAKVRHRDFPVLDSAGKYCGMISRRSLLNAKQKKVILVDHNEKTQAVDGLEGAEILEIIDHHRLGSPETIAPVYFRSQPVGCTSTIIYQMYRENNVEIPSQMAGLLCSAIISDTLLFRSPTCTPSDQAACRDLARIAGIDLDQYANELFHAGSSHSHRKPQEIILQDFKKFTAGELEFGVGQITFMTQQDLEEVKIRLNEYLEQNLGFFGVDQLYMMLTNIVEGYSEVLCHGGEAREIGQAALGSNFAEGAIHVKDLVSRKKQLIPALLTQIQQRQDK